MKEDFPSSFVIEFVPQAGNRVAILWAGNPIGDILTDNAYHTDFYRFHDVFHFTFATILGWSPCTRALMGRKRKSDPLIDEVEDGARAKSIEEGISAMIFEDALENNLYQGNEIEEEKLKTIVSVAQRLEVGKRPLDLWKLAIKEAYGAFRHLVQGNGGRIFFDTQNQTVIPLG